MDVGEWIDQIQAVDPREILGVAGCQNEVMDNCRCRDDRVGKPDFPDLAKVNRTRERFFVDRQNLSAREKFFEKSFFGRRELVKSQRFQMGNRTHGRDCRLDPR